MSAISCCSASSNSIPPFLWGWKKCILLDSFDVEATTCFGLTWSVQFTAPPHPPPPPPHTTSTKISSHPPSLSPRLKNYSNWTLPVGTKCAVQYFFWHRMLIASEKIKTCNGAFKLLVLKFHNFVDLPCLAFKSGHFLPRILFPRGFLCKSRLQWLNQVFFVLGGLLH